jgi:hypothetical protein
MDGRRHGATASSLFVTSAHAADGMSTSQLSFCFTGKDFIFHQITAASFTIKVEIKSQGHFHPSS